VSLSALIVVSGVIFWRASRGAWLIAGAGVVPRDRLDAP
jgi:hypothetical protein